MRIKVFLDQIVWVMLDKVLFLILDKFVLNTLFFTTIIFAAAREHREEIDILEEVFSFSTRYVPDDIFNVNKLVEISFFIEVVRNYNLAAIFKNSMARKHKETQNFLAGVLTCIVLNFLNVLFEVAFRRVYVSQLQILNGFFSVRQFHTLEDLVRHKLV